MTALPSWAWSVKGIFDQYGVPVTVWLPIMMIETGGDPNAVGDNGCSYGPFQTNTCGGQGDGYAPAVLADPLVNASIVAPTIGAAYKKCGSNWSCLIANSQRPADVPSYAAKMSGMVAAINGQDLATAWDTLKAGNYPAVSSGGMPAQSGVTGSGATTVGLSIPNPLDALSALPDAIAARTPAIVLGVLGLLLVLIGAVSFGKSSPTVRSVAKVAALA